MTPTTYKCFVFTNVPSLNTSAWSEFCGWNFRCGCSTSAGRLIFAEGSKLYVYGASYDTYWDDNGTDIAFDVEFPWTDLGQRMINKSLKYVQIDTKGKARFNFSIFTDYIYQNIDNEYDPYARMAFVCADSLGYGGAEPMPYGGGRNTREPLLWAIDAHFKIMKMRICGSTNESMRLVGISLAYQMGNMR